MSHDDTAAGPEERRALSRDELDLANRARQPDLGQLSDRDLSDLVSHLRERRNRARDLADRQGREARGKAEPSGFIPAGGNEGMHSKFDYLNDALDRATAERNRRGETDMEGEGASQAELSRKALAMKRASQDASPMLEDGGPLHPRDPDADPGKKPMAETERRTAPSGALDHAGNLPARERSRTRY